MVSSRPVLVWIAAASLGLFACSATSDDEAAAGTDDSEDPLSADAKNINVGFNVGLLDNLAYLHDFFDDKRTVSSGPRLCHTYVPWNIAEEDEKLGNASSSSGSRAAFEFWLKEAEAKCDDVLVSFKSKTHGAPPSVASYAAAVGKFITTPWAVETGFRGTFSYTAWNEPNNPTDPGNGLGVVIPAQIAAAYFMAAEAQCRAHGGCKVAAGDFASNGVWWNDYEFNCSDDTVPEPELCRHASAENTSHAGPSYLDRYKNFIVNHATDPAFGLPNGYRPAFFAFHGWHDINEYLDGGDHCATYGSCVTLRLLKSLGGSWQSAKIWDTETGVDQSANDVIDDGDQACGAAFVMRQTAQSPRIDRLYITRLHNGSVPIGGAMLRGHTLRPAAVIFAERATKYAGKSCR